MKRARAFNRPGNSLSEGLRPYGYPGGGHSLFIHPLPTEIADLALQFGFQPLDEYGLPPLLSRFQFRTEACGLEEAAAYTNWLLQHTLRSSFSSRNISLTAYHLHGAQVGAELRKSYLSARSSSPPRHEFNTLLSKICSSNTASYNPCPCVSGPFQRPLAYLLSGFMGYFKYRPKISQRLRSIIFVIDTIQIAVPDVKAVHLARCTAHMLTMEFLGIRHFPMCCANWPWLRAGSKPNWTEEWSEILEEDRLLVAKLGTLDLEFEKEFKRRNESVTDFLCGFWRSRIKEVKRDMERPLSKEERRGLLDIGVILEENTNNHFGSGSNGNTTSEDDF